MDELRECPACGEQAHYKWDGWAYVSCAACNAAGPWEHSAAAAADAWNAMPRQSDIDALRAALERERETKLAYAAELEKCGEELQRRQHRILELEKAAQRWEPVEDGYTYTDKRDHTLSVYPHSLDIADQHTGDGISVRLPGDVHLCRRVNAPQEVTP